MGKVVQDIRNRKQYTSLQAVEIWRKMGFYSTEEDENFNNFLRALECFDKKYNHWNIPRTYVVPANSSVFDKEMWNMDLGERLARVKMGLLWHYAPYYETLVEKRIIRNYYVRQN